MCHKKLFTGPGLAIHCMQVHKETIDKIPAALPGRDSVEVEVYGMEGIPEDPSDEPNAKNAKKDSTVMNPVIPPPLPPFSMIPPVPAIMPGFPPVPTGAVPPFISPFVPAALPGAPVPPRIYPPVPMVPPMAAPPIPSVPVPPLPHVPVSGTSIRASSMQLPPGGTTSNVPAAFPAYSDTAKVATEQDHPKETMQIQKLGSKTHIMHPDENVSLEERLARMKGYL